GFRPSLLQGGPPWSRRLGLSIIGMSVEEPNPEEYRRLSAALVEQAPDAIVVTYGFGVGIVRLAAQQRLPAIYPSRFYTDLGGLLAYGSDATETARQIANVVRQILGGIDRDPDTGRFLFLDSDETMTVLRQLRAGAIARVDLTQDYREQEG